MWGAMVFIFFTGYMFSRIQGNSSVQTGANPSQGLLTDQSSSLLDPDWSGREGSKFVYFPNLEGTLAVFATKNTSIAMVNGKEIRVGDHIILDDSRGEVSEIHPDRLILRTSSGTMQFLFPDHIMMGQETYGIGEVVIYPEPGNLMPILQTLCAEKNLKLAGSPVKHSISGRFDSINSLLDACSYFGIKIDKNLLVVPEASEPRSYISYEGFWSQPKGSIAELAELYGYHLPYQIKTESLSSKESWAINFGLQFDEFCEFFKLSTEIQGRYLIVKGGNHENGKNGS